MMVWSHSVTCFVILLLVLVVVAPQHALASVLYERTIEPSGWTRLEPSPADARVTFLVALKQRNLDALDAAFWAISDPQSPRYQDFMTSAEVNALVAPDPVSVELVHSWLLASGIDSASIRLYSDAVEVQTTVSLASTLFSTTFFAFVRSKQIVHKAWGTFSVPDHVRAVIDFVEGLSTFPVRDSAHAKIDTMRKNSADGTVAVVPQTLRALYGVPIESDGAGALGSPSAIETSQGVVSFVGLSVLNDATVSFNKFFSTNVSLITKDHYIGQFDPMRWGSCMLGVQWQGAISPQATPWYWSEQGETWLFGWTVHFLNSSSVPQVVSVEGDIWEGDQCAETNECSLLGVSPTEYVIRTNVQFQKIGLTGVTIVTGTGSSGANQCQCGATPLQPTFPATSPFVTSVSSTDFSSLSFDMPDPPPICKKDWYSCIFNGTEVPLWSNASFYSLVTGGGFSNISSQPAYQADVVSAYLASGVTLPPPSYYNAGGRAIPDVAAVAKNGFFATGAGSSVGIASDAMMAVYIFAGIASLLNSEAIQVTGKPLGFLNPLLYQMYASNPQAFHDMTTGNNICVSGEPAACQGFYATKGWDAVAGLGTPNYPEMVKTMRKILESRKVVEEQVREM